MRITRLEASNIKKLVAIEVTPEEGAMVTVAGPNGAGKSSVLDSIAYALGGMDLVPSEPIRLGQESASVQVTLEGGLTVTRKFKREGEKVTSTLRVTTSDGASYPSPQTVLNHLIGKLTFDPLEFSREKPAKQLETLRQLTNIDTTPLDHQRKAAYDRRTLKNRTLVSETAVLGRMPVHEGVPEAEVSIKEISSKMLSAEKARKAAEDAERAWAQQVEIQRQLQVSRDAAERQVEALEKQLKQAKHDLSLVTNKLPQQEGKVNDAAQKVVLLKEAIPDVNVIRQELEDTETLNAKVRDNAKHQEQVKRVVELQAEVEAETTTIQGLDVKKQQLISSVTFPIEGLAFGDDGVLFNDVPLEQCSRSEQLRISVAIGLALNPGLKVLLIRDGNVLDSKSLRQIAEQAQEANAQVWMEWVAESKDGVAVYIEDGNTV